MAEWSRIAATTIAEYFKGVQDELFQNRKLLAMAKKKGRIIFNCGGDGFKWDVEYRRVTMSTNNGEQTLTFNRQDRYKQATLDYQGYAAVDSITKRERLKNARGASQIVDVFAEMAPRLKRDIEQQFGEEFYVDSTATGNSNRWSGIETMMPCTQTLNIATGVARSATAGDVVGVPTGTYGGLTESLGYYGGSWNSTVSGNQIGSTWPSGKGDASATYDFYTPVIVNYTSSAFGGSTATWADQCVAATRFAINKAQRYSSKEDSLDMMLTDGDMFRVYCNKLDSKERINTTSSIGLRALGFEDSIQQDGVDISWEFGIPAGVMYGFNMDQFTVRSMQDVLFKPEGPEYDMASRSWRLVVDCLGQFKFQSPRYFTKLAALA